ncbi:MAG TPA: hypothetical protein ENF23_01120 [Methanosarcinales archaeon]|nr:MAG: hypothetical protein DRO03_09375 [Methanosarcinales archaeon]HDN64891.1 hypothetical protein [Methanosarcinales archaeon]
MSAPEDVTQPSPLMSAAASVAASHEAEPPPAVMITYRRIIRILSRALYISSEWGTGTLVMRYTIRKSATNE